MKKVISTTNEPQNRDKSNMGKSQNFLGRGSAILLSLICADVR